MLFKVDENLHDDVAALLVSRGHDADTVYAEGLRGCDDLTIAQLCHREGRILVTCDLDFADIRAFPPAAHEGMIVLRVGNQSRRHILNVMDGVVDLLKREPIAGRLWIASEAGLRIRG